MMYSGAMDQESKLFYKTKKSKTVFHAEESDPEDIGLADYRAMERQKVLDFLQGDSRIMVIGGVSGTSKSFMLGQMAKSNGLHWYDMYGTESGIREARYPAYSDYTSQALREMITQEAETDQRSGDGSSGIVIDEGTKFVYTPEITPMVRGMIEELLNRYGKIIVLGGGNSHTSEEQTDMIADLMPEGVGLEKLPFLLKTLNIRQTMELMRLRFARSKNMEMPSDEILEIIAGSYLGYFRLIRRVWLSCGNIVRGNLNDMCLRESIMPDECFDRACDLQWPKYLEARERIEALMAG